MSNQQHTPGPWVYSLRTGKEDTHCISGPQGKIKIAELVNRNDTEKMSADARLIASAPELLDVLSDCALVLDSAVRHTNGTCNAFIQVLEKARAAIEKATA